MNKYTAKIRDAKSKISTFIFDNNLKGLKEYLNDFDEDQRAEIVNNDGGDWCVLFNACRQGHVDIVKYLILDCSADVELRCSYYIRQDSSHEGATALFVAVSKQHYPVVQLLVSHAANVNAATSYGLTPLRCACYSRNVSIVKYLVQNGANVHQPNEYSRKTLLMTAVRGPVELCTFLVNNGASVNEKTIDGYTAIWDAVMLGRLDIVKFLLHAGASPFMNIPKKVHILYVAAFAGNKVIFNYIRDNTVIDLPRLIDGYELLGATAIDKDNIQEGLELWEKAMALRYNSNPEAPLVKDIPNATKKSVPISKRMCNT
ncbi:protein fem-1 homolog C-like [Argopecten irradians]|uniref:protein fem-1 homolog C-like n=1 Tax=Argopecten irradians TaxID=31199 RepID=UPI00371EEA01